MIPNLPPLPTPGTVPISSAFRTLVMLAVGWAVGRGVAKQWISSQEAALFTEAGITIGVGLLSLGWSWLERKSLLQATPPTPKPCRRRPTSTPPPAAALAMLILPALVLLGVPVGGCADKPGQVVESPSGMTTTDPSNTSSTAFLRDEGGSLVTGKLGVETSRITEGEMQETNSGSALKQRLAFRWPVYIQGARADIQTQLSAASNLRIEGVEAELNDDGSPKSLKIALITTDNEAVQRAVNEAVSAEVTAWITGTQADRDVQIKRLEVQSTAIGVAGDVAKAALPLLKLLAGVP